MKSDLNFNSAMRMETFSFIIEYYFPLGRVISDDAKLWRPLSVDGNMSGCKSAKKVWPEFAIK